jgi:hypothetical protein
MKNFYIYPHLGLGDQIICNAIIRNIAKKFIDRKIILFCKHHTYTSVQFMYRDIDNLLIVKADDNEVHEQIDSYNEEDKIYIGHHHLGIFLRDSRSFDEAFYKQVGLPFIRRWDDFYVTRDSQAEKTLFDQVNLQKGSYIFIHDDPKRNLIIDRNFIANKDLPIFIPNIELTDNIFDYLTIMENAAEIHCMDSCFRLLADSVLLDRPHLYYHLNLKNNLIKDPTTHSQSKLSWKII